MFTQFKSFFSQLKNYLFRFPNNVKLRINYGIFLVDKLRRK